MTQMIRKAVTNAFQAIEEHQNGAAPTARNGGSGGGGVAGNGVGGGVGGSGSGVSTRARVQSNPLNGSPDYIVQ